MSRRRSELACPREPLGLRMGEAARFVGMSVAGFRRSLWHGEMPAPRVFGGVEIWDADELTAAFKARPHKPVDLAAGVDPMHDEVVPHDPWDSPRA